MAKKRKKSPRAHLPKTHSRAGSHAGRGFRYQDAATAWLAVRCWAGDLEYGSVTPEGLDDAELVGLGCTAFIQMKSRRHQLGPYTSGDIAVFLRELWDRAEGAPATPDNVVLVLERGIQETDIEPDSVMPLDPGSALGRLANKQHGAKKWAARTHILVAPTPAESAIDLLVKRLTCAPIMAAVYFAAIADSIGGLSDDNGERSPGEFLSLSVSDIEHEIERLAGVLSSADLDAPIRQGLCEPVDFLTPLYDPNFYLGTDVQPGHLAAGLLAERPEARASVLDALERNRAVLIAGPSGSGKSGLMWETARNSRHTIRWFRVRSVEEDDAIKLLRLSDTFRATQHMPIGFVLDDVGRNRSRLWDRLTTEAATRRNVLMLGSVREEDVFLFTRRSLVKEIRQLPDSGLAERIWRELQDRSQTDWPGWREPWQEAGGLLLEYTHLLSQGRRLWDVLKEQVEYRAREKRHIELAVLRVASMAGRVGSTVSPSALKRTLDIGNDDLSEALRRLIDEHLVQRIRGGERLSSLHQIRAGALVDITHELPPPEKEETVQHVLACIDAEELESFVERTLAIDSDLANAIVKGAVDRIRREQDVSLVAPILRGLDAGSIGDTVDSWLPQAELLGLPSTQATTAVWFAVAKTAPFLERKLRIHFEAAKLLRETTHYDHRKIFVNRIESQLPVLLPEYPDWRAVTALLAAIVGMQPSPSLEKLLEARQPDLAAMPLKEVVELLETSFSIFPSVARTWVNRVGQAALLERLTREVPWISLPIFREEPEGLAICADVFHISDRLQSDLHGCVVELCETLIALAPAADVVIASVIAPDGRVAGIDVPIAAKRIPRANLPARAVTTRNRRWLAAVAQGVRSEGRSRYLAKAKSLLDILVPSLSNIIDGIVRRKLPQDRHRDRLDQVYEASQSLSRPPDVDDFEATVNVGVSDLQNVLHFCSTSLVRGILELPDNAVASYSLATQSLAHIDRASMDEPWGLIDDRLPPSMTRLRKIVEQARFIISEAGARGVKAYDLAPGIVRSARSTKALDRLSSWAKRQMEARLKRLNDLLISALRERGYYGRAGSRLVGDIGGPWPFAEVLVVVELEEFRAWPFARSETVTALREACGDGRKLTIVPAVAGFSLGNQAISGVETFFPLRFADTEWLEELGFPAADLYLTGLLDDLINSLYEASAIEAFDCATMDRAPNERSALEKARWEISSIRGKLEQSLSGAEWELIRNHLEDLQVKGPALARNYWEGIHTGTQSKEALAIDMVYQIIIDVDVRIQHSRSHE